MTVEDLANNYADRPIMPKGHVLCPLCYGRGVIDIDHGYQTISCRHCNGTGSLPIDKAIEYEAHHDSTRPRRRTAHPRVG